MLIGITGNIWSGKDTVAKMIQFYFGQKSSTEYFNSLGIEKFLKYYETSEYNSVCSACENYFEIKKFAGKLKQIAALLIGCKPEDFESQEFKNQLLSYEWQPESKEYIQNWCNNEDGKEPEYRTVRWLLQTLGTEAIRNNIHKETWVNALFADYKVLEDTEGNVYEPNWIISDVRFLNEAKSIKDRNGIILKLNRNNDNNHTHSSETELNNIVADYQINNNGSIEELYKMVCLFLKEFNL